jgi:hypothetical protein
MAVEAKRGCGYRKVGGLYLVSDKSAMMPCCKLPIILKICPCCGQGIKQARGWTWIDPQQWLAKLCEGSKMQSALCPAANPEQFGNKAGLLWIGEAFYKTPADFIQEAQTLGISRRIFSVPRGFEVGKHWVFFAHPNVLNHIPGAEPQEKVAGIFHMFKPTRIEKIITQSMADDEELMEDLLKRKITPVVVPDNDKDHQGSVYDPKNPVDKRFGTEPNLL